MFTFRFNHKPFDSAQYARQCGVRALRFVLLGSARSAYHAARAAARAAGAVLAEREQRERDAFAECSVDVYVPRHTSARNVRAQSRHWYEACEIAIADGNADSAGYCARMSVRYAALSYRVALCERLRADSLTIAERAERALSGGAQ